MKHAWPFLRRYGVSLCILAGGLAWSSLVPWVGAVLGAVGGWCLAMDLCLPGWVETCREANGRVAALEAEPKERRDGAECPTAPAGPNDSCVI